MPNTGMSSMTMFRLKAEMLQRHGWRMITRVTEADLDFAG
jgi:hypothetical protein